MPPKSNGSPDDDEFTQKAPSKGVHVYAKSAALSVEPYRGDPSSIVWDIAPANDGRYDWSKKVSIKLDTGEQMRVIAVLSGVVNEAVFIHGKGDGAKRLSIEAQQGSYYVQFSAHKGYALPVGALDAGVVVLALATAICERFPKLSSADVLSVVRMSLRDLQRSGERQ